MAVALLGEGSERHRATWSARLLGILLGVIYALPTLFLFVEESTAAVTAGMAAFLVPLVWLTLRSPFDPDVFRAGVLVIIAMLIPLLTSMILHLPSYEGATLTTILSRVAAVVVFLGLVTMLVMQPDRRQLVTDGFASMGVVLAGFFVFASIFFPYWHWGRFTPGEMQPNWWGEVLIAVTLGACFVGNRLLRYGMIGLALAGLVLVQSRSGLMGALPIVVAGIVAREGVRRLLLGAIVACLAVFPIVAILDWVALDGAIGDHLVGFVVSDVLLLDDPRRGLESGATGRSEGWALAIQLWQAEPFLGLGFGRSNLLVLEATDYALHSGHLMLLADLGLVFYTWLLALIAGAIVRAWRRGDLVLAALVVGYLLVMLVQPRAINANVLSMLSWMAIGLAWLLPLSIGDAAVGASLRSSDLGARWRRVGGPAAPPAMRDRLRPEGRSAGATPAPARRFGHT